MKFTNRTQDTARNPKPEGSKRFDLRILLLLTFALSAPLGATDRFTASATNGNPSTLIWDSPSEDSKGSMPIGNGDIGANIWVEPSGDVVFYLSKTDTWDESVRLLKLGRVRVRFTPPLLQPGGSFTQILQLAEGRIRIQTAASEVDFWVDANHPVVQVDAKSTKPFGATATLELWRKDKRELKGREAHSAGGFPGTPFVWPDTVVPSAADRIIWYHHNSASHWQANLKTQALQGAILTHTDPILHRTFGALMEGDGFIAASDTRLETKESVTSCSLRIHPLTQITDTPEQWLAAVKDRARMTDALDVARRFDAHRQWWAAFWRRSWISVVDDKGGNGEMVTRAYTLQRWMNACSGRGKFPIKFNGSIFTVDAEDQGRWDADYRLWGGGYWFQNTRLPYWSMLEAGDFDLMQPLFRMYLDALPLRKLATKNYYGHEGAFFPETMYFWGTYLDNADLGYGIDRAGKPDGLTDNQYIRRYWQGGIELVAMMLDCYDHTRDEAFRDRVLLPLAREITTFFDDHWPRGSKGKIVFHPSQSLETWWDCTNPLPEIAGLRYILPRLSALLVEDSVRRSWQTLLNDLPPIPTAAQEGRTHLLPAEEFASKNNSENTELYAVFPYRVCTLLGETEWRETGKTTWPLRRHKENLGWQQNAIQAALLGFPDDARRAILEKARNTAAGFRFPAMWGPNYDWIPDQDNGGVLMCALQRMLMQCEDRKILLLPAWPTDWNADFKLCGPYQTTVEGTVRAGKFVNLKVLPESRRKDIVVATGPLRDGTR